MRWRGSFAIALGLFVFALGIMMFAQPASASIACGSSSCSLLMCGTGNQQLVYCAGDDGNPCPNGVTCSAGECSCREPPSTCRSAGLSCGNTGDCCVGLGCSSGTCTAPSTPAACGNGIVESGEQCDLAGVNGVCPSICTSSCTTQTCPEVRRGQNGGTNWASYTMDNYANPPAACTYTVGGNHIQSCESDTACTNIGSIVPVASGEGFNGWLCKYIGYQQDPALLKCDSTTEGDDITTNNTAGAAVTYCCTNTGGSTYAFVSGACSASTGVMRSGGADGLSWGTGSGEPVTGGLVHEVASTHAPCADYDQCIPPSGLGSCLTAATITDVVCTVPATSVLWSGSYNYPDGDGTNNEYAWYKCDGSKLGQELNYSTAFSARYYVCTQKAGCSSYEFQVGRKSTICTSTYGLNADCSRSCGPDSDDIYIGKDVSPLAQAWTWEALREVPENGWLTTNAGASCDTDGNECVSFDPTNNGCFEVGEVDNPFTAANQWICGDDSAGDPAWYICQPSLVDHIYPGTDMCCMDTSPGYHFATADDTCCAQDGVCNDLCATDPDCGSGCESTCAPNGARQCVGSPSTFQRCIDLNGDGCTEWHYYQCASGYVCSDGSCIAPDCDADNDGSNDNRTPRSGPSGLTSCTLSTQTDCRSDNTAVGGGFAESVSNRCADGWDNDCEGSTLSTREADYDGYTSGLVNSSAREGIGTAPKGDSACTVGLSAIAVTPGIVDTTAECVAPIAISCTANVGSIRSIELTGISGCTSSWSGATVTFSCPRPADGSYTVTCAVNTSKSYVRDDATYDASKSAALTVACIRNVSGVVRDAVTGGGIASASISYSGGSTTSQSDGTYTFGPTVAIGTYNFTATKAGYYAERRTGIVVSANPTSVNFSMSPEQCTSDCTFAGVCDYACIGQNGCFLPDLDGNSVPDTPTMIAEFKAICQGAGDGSQRDFNTTHIANCCRGLIEPKALHETALTISSCASQLIPHQTIVNYNGKPHLLTVMSYRACE